MSSRMLFLAIATEKNRKSRQQEPTTAMEHAKAVVQEEEVGDYLRTGRSGVNTKLADVRAHDHGMQEFAHKIVHHAETVKESKDVKEAMNVERKIQHIHEHRTLLSGFTL